MIKQLLAKWFGIDLGCATCEVLREQLYKSDAERRELLTKLLDKGNPEPPSTEKEEFKPITPQYVPWRVRREMLEAEDRKAMQLMRDKKKEIDNSKEIAELEKELDINHDVSAESGGVKFQEVSR